jgi:hypothetical protein
MSYSLLLFIFQIQTKYIQGQPIDTGLLSQRLFLEAELPFYTFESKQYPTTTQGKFHSLFFLPKIIFIHF